MYDLTDFQRELRYVIAGADQPPGQEVTDEVSSTTVRSSITADCIPISTPS